MKPTSPSTIDIEAIEKQVEVDSKEKLADLLYYFRYIQDTLLIAFHNGGKPIPIQNTPNNPQLLTFVATTRSFALAKTAMDQVVRGYPFAGIALSRILTEIAQSNQFLVRHPEHIDRYIAGKLKLEQIFKLAKQESVPGTKDYFGRFWGLMSNYAHASPDLLAIPLNTSDYLMTSHLVIREHDRIAEAAYGVMISLLTQYMIFRLLFLNELDVASELNKRDNFIFDPQNISKYAKFGAISGDDLITLYSLLTNKTNSTSSVDPKDTSA